MKYLTNPLQEAQKLLADKVLDSDIAQETHPQ